MKTIRVVAAVIKDEDKIFATQRGYGDLKGGEYRGVIRCSSVFLLNQCTAETSVNNSIGHTDKDQQHGNAPEVVGRKQAGQHKIGNEQKQ